MKTIKTIHVWGTLLSCLLGCAFSKDTQCGSSLCARFVKTLPNGDVIRYIPKSGSPHLRLHESNGLQNLICKLPDCLSHPCLNEATCTETVDGYDCLCYDKYRGTHCEDRLIESVSLHGGNSSEGRVAFNQPNQTSYFLRDSWTMDASHLVCRHLGFTGAFATVSDDWYDSSDLKNSSLSSDIGCPTEPKNISECWYISKSVKNNSHGSNVAVVCCNHEICGPIGRQLRKNIVPDSFINESSCWFGWHEDVACGRAGRIDGPYAWVKNRLDPSPWVQIFFGENLYLITGVITQGRSRYNQWVTSYYLSYIRNGVWTNHTEANKASLNVFPGNYDRETHVTNILRSPILTRYIRIHPITFEHSPSLRFDVYGMRIRAGDQFDNTCQGREVVKLGIEDGRIDNTSMTASSLMDVNQKASYARLNLIAIPDISPGAWMPEINDTNPWLKIDLGGNYHVTGVITQGRDHSVDDDWTTSFSLFFSTNDLDWETWKECGIQRVFSANYDRSTPVTSLLSKPVVARLVRIHPLTHWRVGSFALRCEILGYHI